MGWLIPTKKQWKNWKAPTKLGWLSAWMALLGLPIALMAMVLNLPASLNGSMPVVVAAPDSLSLNASSEGLIELLSSRKNDISSQINDSSVIKEIDSLYQLHAEALSEGKLIRAHELIRHINEAIFRYRIGELGFGPAVSDTAVKYSPKPNRTNSDSLASFRDLMEAFRGGTALVPDSCQLLLFNIERNRDFKTTLDSTQVAALEIYKEGGGCPIYQGPLQYYFSLHDWTSKQRYRIIFARKFWNIFPKAKVSSSAPVDNSKLRMHPFSNSKSPQDQLK